MKAITSLFLLVMFALPAFGQSEQAGTDSRGYLVKVGDMAPDFTIKYTDGKTAQLSSLRGKVVMLQFTASWCSVCRKEMPHIESDIWKKNKKNKRFALIGIDYKEDSEKIKSFAQKTGVSYPIVLDESGDIFHLYAEKNAGVTRNIIIDATGKIIFLTRLYDEGEFKNMVEIINRELAKTKK